MRLVHRHFVIGITGGIAAYKTCELVRRLQDEGATVQVVMTEAGTRFVSALTFQALSGRPVYTDEWQASAASSPANGMAHIDLAREADAILIAPASADFIAQLANGQTGNLLATLCLARDVPLLVAPAMNRQMWEKPATQRNIDQLKKDGMEVLGPGRGAQACGETGDGRMLEPAELLEALIARFGPDAGITSRLAPNIRGVLEGKHVLITAGPTFEPIDPVRGITNRSSGKMGYAIARAAAHAGAQVTLVSGPVALKTPERVCRIDVTTAQEMHDAVMKTVAAQSPQAFMGVAAVADWRPAAALDAKLKKESGGGLGQIQWIENPDILASVASLRAAPFCIGFAAETGSMEDLHALLPAKRARKGVPLLVGNIGPDTFGADSNQVLLCDEKGIHPIHACTKDDIAALLVFEISKRLSA
jgi:phosphopantothenoylcysteine decarboxylase / phosphopantothenate---cysteine ligase